MEQEKKIYVNRQIAVLKTGNYLVELVDNLKPAASHFTAHLHARGDKYTDRDGNAKRDESSLIQIFMRDYSNKDAESTAVYMNLEPERIRWYQNWVSLGVPEYKDSQEKIFGKPDPEGYSIVTKIKVSRQDSYNGQKRTRPWSILVENGKGIKQEHSNGGVSCKAGSYVPLKKVVATLTDYEFYMLMTRGVKYLDAVENRYMLQPMMTGLFNTLFMALKGLLAKKGNMILDAGRLGNAEISVDERRNVSSIGTAILPAAYPVIDEEPDLPFFPKMKTPKLPDATPKVTSMETEANSAPAFNAVKNQHYSMSYEEAKAVEIPFGQFRGKNLGSLAMEQPDQLRWYAESYRGSNHKLKMAAKMLIESLKAA